MNQLVASRYAELLRRWLGEDLIVDSVAPELQPVLVLEDDPDELAMLKQERLWSDLTSLAAQAAITNGTAIVNPLNSGNIVRIELILPMQDTVQLGLGNLLNAAINVNYTFSRNPILTDTRLTQKTGQAASASCQVFQKTTGAFVGGPANTGRIPPSLQAVVRYVLSPGMFLQIEQVTVNTNFTMMVIGRERGARPEELVINQQ